MELTIIAAVAKNGVIGKNGQIPWMGQLPLDLKRFKALTIGHPVIMGRRTHESIGQRLPERENFVISQDRYYWGSQGCVTTSSLEEALRLIENLNLAGGSEPAFVIGGAYLYREALRRARKMHLTRIEQDFEGDTLFPEFDQRAWSLLKRVRGVQDERNSLPHRFETWVRNTH